MNIKDIIIIILLTLIAVLLYLQISNNRQLRDTEAIHPYTDSEIINTENSEDLINSVNNELKTPDSSDMRSTININEKNSEPETVCLDDVLVCTSGGYGEPNYSIELRRVPPTCEFPACPG